MSKPADRLRRFRQAQGLTLVELATALGVHRTYVGKVESGERNPGICTFTVRLEKLSANWVEKGKKLGPILASEWTGESDFEVVPLPAPRSREASR